MLEYEFLKKAFNTHSFFKGKTWRVSPTPLALSEEIVAEISQIGSACFDFLQSINRLYYASKTNKSILRNKNSIVPWVAAYFDSGKPEAILEHSNLSFLKNALPSIIRPDLILTEEGIVVTEIETVPGGIGFTSFLNQLYENDYNNLIGSASEMLNGFYDSLADLHPQKDEPVLVIAVSNESETYRPEFEWLANQLQGMGKQTYCIDPEEVYYENSKLKFVRNGKIIDIDIIYRFFELFDLKGISTASIITKAIENQDVIISPPLRTIFEEKLCFGLFYHYQLEDYWKEALSKPVLELLQRILPRTWIMDGEDFGPNAVLNGPHPNGKPLKSWNELAEVTQKNRNYIIKMSGFHEEAWGGRSITLGSDCSQEEWAESIKKAVTNIKRHPFIIQEFKKPKSIMHPIYNSSGQSVEEAGRIRLCPYYMKDRNEINIKGMLATVCPADKKIIHGMSVASFIPCSQRS